MFKKRLRDLPAARAYHAVKLDAGDELELLQALRGSGFERSALGEVISRLVDAVKPGRGKSYPVAENPRWMKQSAVSL